MSIEKKVISIISETLKIQEEKIILQSKLIDLVHDSIQLFELLVRFESEIGKDVSYEDIANIETVGDIVNYAQEKGIVPREIKFDISSLQAQNN